jgi:integrase
MQASETELIYLKKVMKTQKSFDLLLVMERFIRVSACGRRRKPDGDRISRGTIVNYRNTYRLLDTFCREKQVHWEVDTSLRISATRFRQRKAYWERFWRQFSDFLYARGYADNYVANIFKILRAVLRYLHHQYGYTENQFLPYRWVRNYHPDFQVIGREQLQALLSDRSLYKKLSPRLRRIRKIMIAGCLTALRASDLLNLRSRNIIDKENRQWLEVRSKKTKHHTRMLMPSDLAEILRRKANPSGRLLPRISNVNLNIGIKKLAEQAGWTWAVSPARLQRGRPIHGETSGSGQTIRYCDQLTTHSLRRSAITLLLRAGMPETLVRRISGHQPGSKEFHRYVVISQDWLDEHTEKAFGKLLGTTGISLK